MNAIFQRLRREDITGTEAQVALEQFSDLPIQLLDPPGLYRRAFFFARTYQLTNIYDALYVVLAEMMDAELWTDDRTLINRLSLIAPWIRSIGDYPPT